MKDLNDVIAETLEYVDTFGDAQPDLTYHDIAVKVAQSITSEGYVILPKYLWDAAAAEIRQ